MQQKVNSLAQLLFHKVRREGGRERGRKGGGREGGWKGGRGEGGRGEGRERGREMQGEKRSRGLPFVSYTVCWGFPQSIGDSPSLYLLAGICFF